MKDNVCSFCKEKLGFRQYIIGDGSYLCKRCFNKIPARIREQAKNNWFKSTYHNFYLYLNDKERICESFKETVRYQNVCLDEKNLLLATLEHKNGRVENSDSLIYDLRNVIDVNINFTISGEKKIFFERFASVNFIINIISGYPPIQESIVLKENVWCKCKYNKISKSCDVILPHEINVFSNLILNAFQKATVIKEQKIEQQRQMQEAENTNEDRAKENVADKPFSELESAMAMFMIDDLKEISEEELKKRRNKLIKTFHPDTGESNELFSQKINQAYDILGQLLRT